MKPASEIELTILRDLWSHQSDRELDSVCPNCLARRKGSITDTPHKSWCAIGRLVAAEERNQAEYLVSI